MSKSRSGKNNQEWEDVQSAAQVTSSDVRGGTNIQIRFSQVMLEESREEQRLCTLILFQSRLMSERGKLHKCR